jgi:hypothetical protein
VTKTISIWRLHCDVPPECRYRVEGGEHLNFPLLGTLQQGAPADIIAVKGNLAHNLKILEYPDLVLSGGKIIVNNLTKQWLVQDVLTDALLRRQARRVGIFPWGTFIKIFTC